MLYRLAWFVFYLVIRILVFLFGRGLKVSGRDNVPRGGGVIVAPNHVSFADPPIVEAVVQRGSWFMATDELFERPILGRLAKLMRGYPVKQDSPDRAALRRTEDLLKRGESVVVFPEGHVSLDGKLQPIQQGTVLVALRVGVPILPVGLLRTDEFMPPRTFKIRKSSGPIEVRIGKLITAEELAGGNRGRAAVDHGAELLRRALLELTGQADTLQPEAERIGGTDGQPEPASHLHAVSSAEYSRG